MSTVDWTATGTMVAALATTILAGATVFLSVKTKSVAEETSKLAAVAREEVEAVGRQATATEQQAQATTGVLAASIRPWLTAHWGAFSYPNSEYAYPQVELRDGAERYINGAKHIGIQGHIVVRNVGNGLAVLPERGSWVWGRNSENRSFSEDRFAFPQSAILAPHEVTVLEFFVENVSFETFVGARFGYDILVHVLYTDAEGGQPAVATFRVSAYPDRPPQVFDIEYRHLSAVPSLAEADTFVSVHPFAHVRSGLPGTDASTDWLLFL